RDMLSFRSGWAVLGQGGGLELLVPGISRLLFERGHLGLEDLDLADQVVQQFVTSWHAAHPHSRGCSSVRGRRDRTFASPRSRRSARSTDVHTSLTSEDRASERVLVGEAWENP